MIGGNITAEFQIFSDSIRNEIGEVVAGYRTVTTLTGFLDYSSGETGRTNYKANIEETTHIFICDYVRLDDYSNKSRMVINGKMYDVKMIDNPLGLNRHLEIYLKYTGR